MRHILNAFNCITGFVLIFALCCLDSESFAPTLVFLSSAAALFAVNYIVARLEERKWKN